MSYLETALQIELSVSLIIIDNKLYRMQCV